MTDERSKTDVSSDEVIRKYFDMVYKLALSQTKNQTFAEDVTQDVFVKLLRSGKRFEGDEHLRYWLVRVTINECKSLFRKPWRRVEDIEAYAETLQAPSEQHRDLLVRVMRLPEKYRVPMVLHYYIGLSTDEVARAIKVPAATVRTRLARGRAKLKSLIEEEDHVPAPFVQRGHESAARL